jgi:hypothetical protein
MDLFKTFIEKANLPKDLILATRAQTTQQTKQAWGQLKKEFLLDHLNDFADASKKQEFL